MEHKLSRLAAAVSDGSENLALENFILSLANKPRARVCLVPTASGDSEQYLLKFYAYFAKLPATAAHLPLFQLAVTDLRSYLLGQEGKTQGQVK